MTSTITDASAANVSNFLLHAGAYVWCVPLILLPLIQGLRSTYRSRNPKSKATELAFYSLYIPIEFIASILLLVYCTVHTMQMAFTTFVTEAALVTYVSTYLKAHVYSGYLITTIFTFVYTLELCFRMDTFNWQQRAHRYAALIIFMLCNISIRNNSNDTMGQLIVWDSAMLTTLLVAFDWIPHVALLCRRLNDGYHTIKLMPDTHWWRYYCKQVEHVCHILCFTVMPLIRTAIALMVVVYYFRAYNFFTQFITNPQYVAGSWVVLHCILLLLLYGCQWAGAMVVYKHMYLKSVKEQRSGTVVTEDKPSDVTSSSIAKMPLATVIRPRDATQSQSSGFNSVGALSNDDLYDEKPTGKQTESVKLLSRLPSSRKLSSASAGATPVPSSPSVQTGIMLTGLGDQQRPPARSVTYDMTSSATADANTASHSRERSTSWYAQQSNAVGWSPEAKSRTQSHRGSVVDTDRPVAPTTPLVDGRSVSPSTSRASYTPVIVNSKLRKPPPHPIDGSGSLRTSRRPSLPETLVRTPPVPSSATRQQSLDDSITVGYGPEGRRRKSVATELTADQVVVNIVA